jgi:Bacterial Ig domain
LTITQITSPVQSSFGAVVTRSADGKSLLYKAPSCVCQDSFSYTITDGDGGFSTTTVSINVYNDAPVVANIAKNIHWSSPAVKIVDLSTDASDLNGDVLSVADVMYSGSDATISFDSLKTQVFFQPLSTIAVGPLSFTYSVTDGDAVVLGNIALNITNVAPVAVNDGPLSVEHNDVLTVNVLANDYDVDSDAIFISSITAQPSKGVATISSDKKTVSFKANNFQIGSTSFTYTITDTKAISNPAVASIQITNNKPKTTSVASQFVWNTVLGQSFSYDVLRYCSDADP